MIFQEQFLRECIILLLGDFLPAELAIPVVSKSMYSSAIHKKFTSDLQHRE